MHPTLMSALADSIVRERSSLRAGWPERTAAPRRVRGVFGSRSGGRRFVRRGRVRLRVV